MVAGTRTSQAVLSEDKEEASSDLLAVAAPCCPCEEAALLLSMPRAGLGQDQCQEKPPSQVQGWAAIPH